VAPHVAAFLKLSVFDLDRVSEAVRGDIDQFIEMRGYRSYAAANVQTYLDERPQDRAVVALSSGFMLYSARESNCRRDEGCGVRGNMARDF
jgi:hypothetical protein